MSRYTALLVLLFVYGFATISFGGQDPFEAARAARLAAVFDSLKKGDAEAFAANLPGLSRKESAEFIERIAAQWGDLSRLTVTTEDARQFDKGKMKTVVHWGTKATSKGKWLGLRSDAAPGRWLRMGLLFANGESQPLQFLAVEWATEAKGAVEGASSTGTTQ